MHQFNLVALLVDDIAALKPTIFASVPRLLNRIYDKIINGALNSGSALKAFMFNQALSAKKHYLRAEGCLTHTVWDPLVFAKVKGVLGGRVRLMISASAPIAGDTLEFLRVGFGCEVLEAYGQTESCGGLTCSLQGDYSLGNVGYPSTCCQVKLVSVPDMGYLAKDLKGEIWVKGPAVCKGYYKEPEKTAETITTDGWLKTGDIGSFDKKGRLSIIDRKKNIFKLSQGEYVAPEKLENIFVKSALIAQIYVHGDSLQNELVAIVIPDPENTAKWAIGQGIIPANTPLDQFLNPAAPCKLFIDLCKRAELNKAIVEDLTKIGQKAKLRGFEYVKAVYLDAFPFSIESNTITPTFKLKRDQIAVTYFYLETVSATNYSNVSKGRSREIVMMIKVWCFKLQCTCTKSYQVSRFAHERVKFNCGRVHTRKNLVVNPSRRAQDPYHCE